ncbi:Mitochondrial intermembrane space import like protein [Argiope bruennichi]|uniref:Mitochondrial intermembrane space import like protein n=2 Tax=Argiope bruennichi TaxID=94029 RepID=A0A8T0EFW5_ARGBR|nr:Mitochondrial intermembrane space import like protein [Argiope bruennichi]
MFLTKEDLKGPSSIVLPESDEPRGLLLPNGEINWGCPCLGDAAIGPCSVEFRTSLSCFHKSTADPKGSDCLQEFRDVNDCMERYPDLFSTRQNRESDEAALKSLDEDTEDFNSTEEAQTSNETTVSKTDSSTK